MTRAIATESAAPTPGTDLDAAVAEAALLLARIRALHAELAASPDPDGPAEDELQSLVLRRAEIGAALGTAVLRVLASGASVAVTPSSDAAHPADTGSADPDTGSAEPPSDRAEPHSDDDRSASPPTTTHTAPDSTAVHDATPSATSSPSVASPSVASTSTPERSSPPAPEASLRALAQRGIGGLAQKPPSDLDHLLALRQLLQHLGRPTRVDTAAHAESLLRVLERAIRGIDAWTDQPPQVQKSMLGLTSSLARHVQDEFDGQLPLVVTEALRSVFSRMTRFSRVERPGYVSGLSRHNTPEHGATWIDDARTWYAQLESHAGPLDAPAAGTPESALAQLEEAIAEGVDARKDLVELIDAALEHGLSQSDPRLVALLTPHQSLLKGARGLKTLKTALKDALRDEDDFEQAQDVGRPVPADWPHFDATQGKRAVILGGDTRPAARDRIQDAFGFSDVQWEISDVRRASALANRIRGGSVDVVLLLIRFIHHRHQDIIRPACNEAGVPLVIVKSGYGVDAVRRAIERIAD